ncbi:MAG: glycosyltransferase family 9 protein [Thermoanaerobaculia bacterium]|nr:glycosyltransferase family 9 protein [Thermoanaerobaculia bacterium]
MSPAPVRRDPERILLVRTSALGDVVHALPVLTALRRRYPAARLAWAVDESFAPLLAGHAHLDDLFALPLRRWRRDRRAGTRELIGFVRALRGFGAEVALDLMGNHKGALLARLSGASRRVGAARAARREPSSALWINVPVDARGAHAVERAQALLAPLDAAGGEVDFAPEAIACGREQVLPGDYLYLHPGAAWGNKRYPPARWGDAARRLGAAAGLEVLVGASPGEEHLADEVVAASGGAARRLAAPTLGHLAGAVRAARLVLAGDTGAVHLARAFGRPVVAVHGPTDPARHGPWADPDGVVFRRLACSFCHRRMDSAKSCLELVAPEEIAARGLAQLARTAV